MQYVNISDTVRFSRIVQGFWRLTDWDMPAAEAAALIDGCLERGVTTLDTAEIYGDGECEVQLGAALGQLKRRREDYQIVTKTGISKEVVDGETFGYYDTGYQRIIDSCKNSLRKLGCEYIDLYLIHREDPLIDHHQVAGALKELKKQGCIREAGVSNFDPFKFTALNNLMDGTLRTNQIEWNPCCFEHFDSGMMDLLVEKQVHPMIWSPLAGGQLFVSDEPRYAQARRKIEQIAARHGAAADTVVYAWLLAHPAGALPISGSHKLERLDAAIAALDLELTRAEWYEIYVASGQQVLR